jgi:hypothetical protein
LRLVAHRFAAYCICVGEIQQAVQGDGVDLEVAKMAVMVRWEPWRMAGELEREVDRLLGRGLGPWMRMPWQPIMPLGSEDRWVPACDLLAREGDLVVRVELPGIDPGEGRAGQRAGRDPVR